MLKRFQKTKFARDIKGATLIYVSLMMALMIGMAGLSVDISRFFIAQTQAQGAADAAAIAAASQLDGKTGALARATQAAQYAAVSDTPLVKNEQRFADDGEADAYNVGITNIRFFDSLPASDDAPITSSFETTLDSDALYVEVTTENLSHENLLLPALGVTSTANVTRTSVATFGSAVCRITPLAICNPAEETSVTPNPPFTIADWKGKEILVKEEPGNSAAWKPGNFGFLIAPEGNGAKSLAGMLGSVDGATKCYTTALETKTGAVNSVRSALNTRFDMYDNPFFNNQSANALYAPAANVTKGITRTGGNSCGNNFVEPLAPDALGFPPDNAFTSPSGVPGGKFGNGIWDCLSYWNVNHGLATPPLECTAATDGNILSRYDVYRSEIEDALVGIPTPGTTDMELQEDGSPSCYTGDPDGAGPLPAGTVVDDPNNDRRVIHFAIMNCNHYNVAGQSTVPAEAFVKAFLTRPVTSAATNGQSDFNIYLEIIDVVETGTQDSVLKEWVEIVR